MEWNGLGLEWNGLGLDWDWIELRLVGDWLEIGW